MKRSLSALFLVIMAAFLFVRPPEAQAAQRGYGLYRPRTVVRGPGWYRPNYRPSYAPRPHIRQYPYQPYYGPQFYAQPYGYRVYRPPVYYFRPAPRGYYTYRPYWR